jgi:hypothetical protein
VTSRTFKDSKFLIAFLLGLEVIEVLEVLNKGYVVVLDGKSICQEVVEERLLTRNGS